jgi:long-chain acyl-CoA synthetase
MDQSNAKTLDKQPGFRLSDAEVAAFWQTSLQAIGRPALLSEARPRTVLQAWRQRVDASAHKNAIICLGGALTFAEIDQRSDAFAHYLLERPFLKQGDRIAIMLPNSSQYMIAILGILKAGMIVVNCNPLYTVPELQFQLVDSGAKMLLTLANLAKTCTAVQAPDLREVVVTEIGDALPQPKRWITNFVVRFVKKMVPAYHFDSRLVVSAYLQTQGSLSQEQKDKVRMLEQSILESDLAFIQYTGGTTGVAKGARLSQGSVAANMQQSTQSFASFWVEKVKELQDRPGPENAVALIPLPFYHIYSLTCGILSCTVSLGMTTLTLPNPRDFKAFFKLLAHPDILVMGLISTLMKALMAQDDFAKVRLNPSTMITSGGMPTSPDVAADWNKRTGTSVNEGYGLTEASPLLAVSDGNNPRSAVAGYPASSTLIKIRDESGRDLPLGKGPSVQGELLAKGPQIMQGYFNQAEETAKVFSDDGYLMTGDIAVIHADGLIEIVDRKKDMILVSGFNVYPSEIEAKAMATGLLLECACIGAADAKSGEKVVLYAVPLDKTLDAARLNEALTAGLTNYKRPTEIVFVDSLPKNPVGKILRREVRRLRIEK